MEVFLVAAGVIGFVGSIDSIINLCERVLSKIGLGRSADWNVERVRVGNIKAIYIKLKCRVPNSDEESRSLLMCAFVYERLSKVVKILSRTENPLRFYTKSINKELDDIDKVLNSYSILLQLTEPDLARSSSATPLPSRLPVNSSTPEDDVSYLLDNKMLLKRILDPTNKKVLTKQTLRNKRVYDDTLKIPSDGRSCTIDGILYMIDRIALGRTPKERDGRLSRLGTLILVMQDCEPDGTNLLPITKIVRENDSFCILSQVEDGYSVLEEILPNLRERIREVLLNIAVAVESLHEMMIVHEGLNSYNILIDCDSLGIKLTGFVTSRMVQDSSDSPEDHMFEMRRKQIYQSPERLAGSRYTFECDIYSLGIVMAEVCIGRAFVNDATVLGRDDIMRHLSGITLEESVRGLIKDCVFSATASQRPPIGEIVGRLSRNNL